jgi:hypothetical protein
MRKLTRALRTAALLAAAVLAFEIGAVGGVMAEPCVWGTNRPGIDTNPAVRADPNAPRMRCDMTVTEHTDPRDGHKFKETVWNFSVGK